MLGPAFGSASGRSLRAATSAVMRRGSLKGFGSKESGGVQDLNANKTALVVEVQVDLPIYLARVTCICPRNTAGSDLSDQLYICGIDIVTVLNLHGNPFRRFRLSQQSRRLTSSLSPHL
jgi:hypothetical protein